MGESMSPDEFESDLTPDERRRLDLLELDLARTLGKQYRPLVARYARSQREFARGAALIARVADEVQQEIMDTFVDVSWPACPRQSNHPLWFYDGAWCCERDGVRLPLGELAASREVP